MSSGSVTLHDSDLSSREQYKAEGCEVPNGDSDCELMTDRQHEVHVKQHEKCGHVQLTVEPSRSDVMFDDHQEHVRDDSASGSSMHRGLPVLLALAAASSTSPTTSHVGAQQGHQGDTRPILSSHPGKQEEDRFKGQAESSNPGTFRLFPDGGARPKGQPYTRLPLLRQSPGDAGREGVFERPEWPCHVEGVPDLPVEDSVRSMLWSKRLLPPGGAISSGCGDGGFAGQGQVISTPRW